MSKKTVSGENVADQAMEVDASAKARGRFGVLGTVVAILFGLVYAYYVWDAIRSLVELPGYYKDIGLTEADVPWWLLIVGLLVPLVVYAAAFLVGRRRSFVVQALIFFVGLTAVAALGLAMIAIEAVIRPFPPIG